MYGDTQLAFRSLQRRHKIHHVETVFVTYADCAVNVKCHKSWTEFQSHARVLQRDIFFLVDTRISGDTSKITDLGNRYKYFERNKKAGKDVFTWVDAVLPPQKQSS